MMTAGLKILFAFAVAMIVTFLLLGSPSVRATAQDDAGALYKSKCAACHGATAEKKFDATLADDELVNIVLKGKKAEKPPNMPAFEDKGITEDQAKALVAFMKSQKH
jgi:mono/diheme cytochrome c family protein